MKAITIRQPWASLIAAGVKTIETRSWSTRYRGPLAIHAGGALYQREICEEFAEHLGSKWPILPLGAVVATCTLADVVPIMDGLGTADGQLPRVANVVAEGRGLRLMRPFTYPSEDITDQLPFGDFTPGRYAWLLTDVQPIDPPVPVKGRQGMWDWDQ